MSLLIRPYHASDLPSLYRICLLTGYNGADASHLYSDPELLGHYYVGPYVVAEPELAFVLTDCHRPIGYVIGARDSAAFSQWCETAWFPLLRLRYPLTAATDKSDAEQRIIQAIHQGHRSQNHWRDYPAHLHIDILPEGQGRGMGRQLMVRLWQKLAELNVPGVQLGVGKANTNAIHFYRHIGYEALEEHPWGYVLGKDLRS